MNKIFSIITVCYNAEMHIEQAIKSVIQEKKDIGEIEYIVIDGKSTDKTLNIINKYKDEIDIFISEPDFGIYDAMNKGLYKASGEWIGFMNSDDWYEPGSIRKVLEEIQKGESDVIVGHTYTVENDNNKRLSPHGDNSYVWQGKYPACHQAIFAKKSLFFEMKNGFVLDYDICADLDMFMHWMEMGKQISYIDCVIANFRINGFHSKRVIDLFSQMYEIIDSYVYLCDNPEEFYNKWNLIAEGIDLGVALEAKYRSVYLDKILENKKLFIYGTGNWGDRISKYLENAGYYIDGFFDGNSNKSGTIFHDRIINATENVLANEGQDIVCIIAIKGLSDFDKDSIRNKMGNEIEYIYLDRFVSELINEMPQRVKRRYNNHL